MTLPSVVRDLLMLAPSFRRVPYCPAIRIVQHYERERGERERTVAPVEACRSLPARSTRDILDTFSPVIFVCGS